VQRRRINTVNRALHSHDPHAERFTDPRNLLAHGADIGQRGINDWTPLHWAVANDDAAAVALLLAHGADPDARTRVDECATPLEEAEHLGKTAAAEALRRHGAG